METMQQDDDFWRALEALVSASAVTIDRPRGTTHPRFPDVRYPKDYGYLAGTRSGDGDSIDVWIGSLPERSVSGAVVTVDLAKRESEIKLLLGCTPAEMRDILAFHQRGQQSALLLAR